VSEQSPVSTWVGIGALSALWLGGMALLAGDAKRRGVNVFEGARPPSRPRKKKSRRRSR
jgi:hypothetical protein